MAPTLIVPPELVNIPPSKFEGHNLVYFDLETSGKDLYKHGILQLAAVHKDRVFDRYVKKYTEVDHRGLNKIGIQLNKKGEVVRKGRQHPVHIPIKTCLEEFIRFLPNNTILISHNCHKFDLHVLMTNIIKEGLTTSFSSKVVGFVDSLKVAKKVLNVADAKSGLAALAERFSVEFENHHDALLSSQALKEIMQTGMNSKITQEIMENCSATVQSAEKRINHLRERKARIKTFDRLCFSKVMTSKMVEKAADIGLTKADFDEAFARDGEQGIRDLLTTPNDAGKPRVSKDRKVIGKIVDYYNENFE